MNINIGKEMARMMAGPEGTAVNLHWVEWDGTETIDAVTKSRIGGNPTAQTESVRGFVHLVKASTVERRFGEIEAGDAIIDIPPKTTIGGRAGLEFEIYGKRYVQKEISGKLSETWDVIEGGTPVLTEFPKASMTADADSYIGAWVPANAIDGIETEDNGDPGWHNSHADNTGWLRLDLGGSYEIASVAYKPRSGCGDGTFTAYSIFVTENPSKLQADWGAAVTSGTWTWPYPPGNEAKTLTFSKKLGRYVIFRGTTGEIGYASCLEVWAYYYPHMATCRTLLIKPKA